MKKFYFIFIAFIFLCGCRTKPVDDTALDVTIDAHTLKDTDTVFITYFENAEDYSNKTQCNSVLITQQTDIFELTESLTGSEYQTTSMPMDFPRLTVSFCKNSMEIEVFSLDENGLVSGTVFNPSGNLKTIGGSPYAEILQFYQDGLK